MAQETLKVMLVNSLYLDGVLYLAGEHTFSSDLAQQLAEQGYCSSPIETESKEPAKTDGSEPATKTKRQTKAIA